ncbi:SRPBCC family protein [Nemorincola caseinilytica]|uniref:SRPBCC family protein n=1 Tax=Nemorincola caseinilytica TaxID=2054315 RepID=A0ABP8N5K0_9BACT
METSQTTKITIETSVNAPLATAWETWSGPAHIMKWNSASPDWHCPKAENDLRTGGTFSSRMEARDGSMGFDFGGVYDEVRHHEYIAYTMGDGRKVNVTFAPQGNGTHILQTFDAENMHPVEMQREGWQSIMNNHKTYTENL